MKVGLINPEFRAEYRWTPLGVGYLAANIEHPEKHDVRIFDLNWISEWQFMQQIKVFRPDILGFTGRTAQFPDVLRLAFRAKFLTDARIVVGGAHAAACPELIEPVPFIDDIVTGEGETVFSQIVNGQLSPGVHDPIFRENLDTLNFPARDKMPQGLFRTGYQDMITSRGCPYNCLFCQPALRRMFGSRPRQRSPENVIAEMWDLFNRGVKRVKFQDDTFSFNRSWIMRFSEEMTLSGPPIKWNTQSRVNAIDLEMVQAMKAAGCEALGFGVETGSQKILNYYRKGITTDQIVRAFEYCRQEKVKAHAFVIVGAPAETPETIQETEDLIKTIQPSTLYVSLLTPLPGTDLFMQLKNAGLLNGYAMENMDYQRGQLDFPHYYMTSEQLNRARHHMLRSFYQSKLLQPAYFYHALRDYPFSFLKHKLRWLFRGA